MASKKLLCFTTASTRAGLLESNVFAPCTSSLTVRMAIGMPDSSTGPMPSQWGALMTDTFFSSSEKRAMGTVLLCPDTTDSLVTVSLPSGSEKEAEKETDVLVIQVLHKLQLNVCNGQTATDIDYM